MQIQIRECKNDSCLLRYPVLEQERPTAICPRCGGTTHLSSERYLSQENRATPGIQNGPVIAALLDNVRSVFNVGSMFRIADGAGITHLHLAGITATPNHPKMRKTALGAEQVVSWTYHPNSLRAAQVLQAAGSQLWALEETHSRTDALFASIPVVQGPIVLIVGNEVAGIDPALLTLCDRVLAIPMQGHKRSLNVAVAFGIAAYVLRCRR